MVWVFPGADPKMKICMHVIYLGIPKMGMKKSDGEVG